ncbi:MAG: FUSC family protein [Actinophytocola sp.]|uniref:FUSC family protein n=1 Tax=Actinophytocola sp. TaxID=1872138 RepID=UPI003D69FEDD
MRVSRARLRAAGRRRVRALRRMGLPVLQCAIAAALAWLVATQLLGHRQPFFAPIAVIICIGVGLGQQRLRRVVELVVGVSVGIGVGDLLVSTIGTGPWQLALVVALAMAAAVLLGGGPLIVLQAGSSAVLVVTLLPPGDSAGLDRMLDALVGGLLGLAAIAVLPGNPPGIARKHGVQMIGVLTTALTSAAEAIERRDPELAAEALRRARTQQPIDDFRDALRTAREILALSPLHRRHRHLLRSYVDAAEPLDHALRNCRVLLRRTRSALMDDEQVPPSLPAGLRRLAAATELLAEHLGSPAVTREALREAAWLVDSDSLAHSGFSAQVVAAQLRSVVVDLLQATGLRHDEARAVLPTLNHPDG